MTPPPRSSIPPSSISWQRVEDAFLAALELPSEERDAFLRERFADDAEARLEVEAMLRAHHSDDREARAGEKTGVLSAGARLGSHRVISLVGRGGMGEVYRAHDSHLDRSVAIKVLPSRFADDRELVGRFRREARALAALNHPNVATLYGFEQADGTPFLVMELVEGETLAERLRRGALPPRAAVEVFHQIASGLEAAHERAIVHRDLKPANVKLSENDASGQSRVKILDFGLARAELATGSDPRELSRLETRVDGETAADSRRDEAATREGRVMGTLGYMSPEQAQGLRVDKRTDVWSFGVCLFEALAGAHPFRGDSAEELAEATITVDPSWEKLPPRLPRRLLELLRRCLEKDPALRLRDIGEARVALGRLREDESEWSEVGSPLRGAGRATVAVAVLAGLAVGVVVAWWLIRPEPSTAPAMPSPVSFVLGDDPGPAPDLGAVAVSPDGRRIVYSAATPGGRRLFVRDLGDAGSRPLEGTEGADAPFFSPDGRSVGFFRGGRGNRTLQRVDLAGGGASAITTSPHRGYRAAWLEDGSIVLGDQLGGLWLLAAGADRLEELTLRARGDLGHVHPEALPGDRGIVFTAVPTGGGQARVEVLDRRSGEVSTVISAGGEARWVDSGHLIYALDGSLFSVPFDLEGLVTRGEPTRVVEGVRTGIRGEGRFSVSSAGTLAWIPGPSDRVQEVELSLLDPDGTVARVLGTGDFNMSRISPDGRRVVAVEDQTRLVLWEEGGAVPLRIEGEGAVTLPAWSPDSATVVFEGQTGARLQLKTVGADAAGGAVELGAVGDHRPGAVAPDGEVLLWRQGTGHSWDVYALDPAADDAADGQPALRPLLATALDERMPRLSRDGRLLAYVSNRGGIATLFVTRYPELDRHVPAVELGPTTPAPRGFYSEGAFAWGPDDRLHYVRAESHAVFAVAVQRAPELRVAGAEEIFSDPQLRPTRGIDVGPDGRYLVSRAAGEPSPTADATGGGIRVVVGWRPGVAVR